MPITQQAKKAMKRDSNRRVFNLRRKRAVKEVVKEIKDLVLAGKGKEAREKLPEAYKAIDKATKRGILKKHTASRRKAHLSKQIKEVSK